MVFNIKVKVSHLIFTAISKPIGGAVNRVTIKPFRSASFQRRQYSCNSIGVMKFIQFQRKGEQSHGLGVLSENGESFADLSATGKAPNDLIQFIKSNASLNDIRKLIQSANYEPIGDGVQLLAPITNPEKIVCIGLNYLGHCQEQNKEAPKEPMFFSKFNNTLTGPTGDVILHNISTKIDWEVELAVIIGKTARHVSKEDALEHVFGYTVAQDISARDWQKSRNGGQFLIGKSMDTFCPLGPAVVHKSLISDPHSLAISCSINGILKQNGNTSELVFRVDDIIHRLSQSITLQPGDVILTGTPSGVGMYRDPPEYLREGDIIESTIEQVGTIRNKAIADSN